MTGSERVLSLGDVRRFVEACAGVPDEAPVAVALGEWVRSAEGADGRSTYPFHPADEALTCGDEGTATRVLPVGEPADVEFSRMVFGAASRRWEEAHPSSVPGREEASGA